MNDTVISVNEDACRRYVLLRLSRLVASGEFREGGGQSEYSGKGK